MNSHELAAYIQRSDRFPEDFGQYVDVGGRLSLLGGKKSIYVVVLKSFLKSGEFEKLKVNLAENDAAAAAITAHGIKGMVGNISLSRLYEETVQLESQLKAGIMDRETLDAYFETANRTNELVALLLAAIEDGTLEIG